jgi:cytochrome c1
VRHLVLLVAIVAVNACDIDPDARVEKAPQRRVFAAQSKQAPAAMRKYGCISCHTIPGVTGARALVGPNLGGFAGRHYIAGRFPNEPDVLIRWIQDPQGMKPQTAMPTLGVSDRDARNIAAYLYELR